MYIHPETWSAFGLSAADSTGKPGAFEKEIAESKVPAEKQADTDQAENPPVYTIIF